MSGRIQLRMLAKRDFNGRGTLIVFVHWLGGSQRSWTEVCEELSTWGIHCVAIDLPGFGDSAESSGFSVAEMVAALTETVRAIRAESTEAAWFLAGHSMGGKLAAVIARASESGVAGLQNLGGMILISPSPPGPEPMQESKREQTIRSLGPGTADAAVRREHAAAFVAANLGRLPLPDSVRRRTIKDILRMNPDALVAWMTTGSKEDWSDHVGVLNVPALILAGTEETALGPDAQEKHTKKHFAVAWVVALEGGGHLAPLERPFEVAMRTVTFLRSLGLDLQLEESTVGASLNAHIDSALTSPQTREVLLQRTQPAGPEQVDLGVDEVYLLRAVAARVVPGSGFDVAARMASNLARQKRDGWRFVALPEDKTAWRRGLLSLDAAAKREFGVPFIALDGARQDRLLAQAREGTLEGSLLASRRLGLNQQTFSASQMQQWFEDVRGELVKVYVSDPRTMERIGFTGYADEQGFTNITLGDDNEAAS